MVLILDDAHQYLKEWVIIKNLSIRNIVFNNKHKNAIKFINSNKPNSSLHLDENFRKNNLKIDVNKLNEDLTKMKNTDLQNIDAINESKLGYKYDEICEMDDDNVIDVLNNHLSLVNWSYLSANPNNKAVDILMNNLDKVDFKQFNRNYNPRVVEYLKNNPKKIDWVFISENKNAIELIMNNLDKISHARLCLNKNPEVFRYLEKNPEKIYWCNLCKNEDVPEKLIINNLHKLTKDDWNTLSSNKIIFK